MTGAQIRVDLRELFAPQVPVIGMVHLLPLPGSPGWRGSMDEVVERAVSDARILEEGGLHGLLVENFGDMPFHPGPVPPETVAAQTRAAAAVVEASALPVGVNVLRNDAAAALAIAHATGAAFIRVNVHAGSMETDQGRIEGRAHQTLRMRRALGADVAILADVHVKHATPPPGQTLEDAARDLWERSGADGLVASGVGTGRSTDPDHLRRLRAAVPDAPLWVGSGSTPETVGELLPLCDGILVGSALQRDGRPGQGVDPDRVVRFMAAVDDGRKNV